MKKLILASVFALITSFGFAQKLKIGHVNTQQIMQSLSIKDSLQNKFMAYQSMLQVELERQQNELVKEEQVIMEAQKNNSLPQEILQQRYQALMKDKQEFQEVIYPQMQQSLQNKMTELQIPLEEKITTAIQTVAKANGFTYVLQLEATLYANGEDITKMVRKELGLPEEAEELPAAGAQGVASPYGR